MIEWKNEVGGNVSPIRGNVGQQEPENGINHDEHIQQVLKGHLSYIGAMSVAYVAAAAVVGTQCHT